MRLKEALILRYLSSNPRSSEWEVASGTNTSSVLTRMYLNNLLSQQLLIEYNTGREKTYAINHAQSSAVVKTLRLLRDLEAKLKNFDLNTKMLH